MTDRPPIAGTSPADRPRIDAASPPDGPVIATPSPALSSAAITNNAAKRWDAKTLQGRRCRDLFRSLMRMVGNPPEPARQALCISAAELMVLAEATREVSLKDPASRNADSAFKAEKAMRHALSALGIDKPPSGDETSQDYGLFITDEDEVE